MIRFAKAKPAHRLIVPYKKSNSPSDEALRKLNRYLEQEEPELVHFLTNDLAGLSNTVTYQELREAYMAGGLTQAELEEWQIKYSKIVDKDLRWRWEQASETAAEEMRSRFPGFYYEPSVSSAMKFIALHGAELCTNLAQEQIDALNAIVAHISGYTAITPDEASLMMRSCIGLTKPQTTANFNLRRRVEQAYMEAHPKANPETARKKAKEAGARYAARQHRYRAMMIARTELAFGYNAGHHGATLDAQEQGFLGEVNKVWITAYDERTCPSCSKLDGVVRRMDEKFPGNVDIPPKHPHCRCAVVYEEVEEKTVDFYVGPNKKALPAKYADWIGDSRRDEYLSIASNKLLYRAVDELYRKGSFIGDGGTEAVRRFEIATGLGCGKNGKTHLQKCQDMIKFIEKKVLKEELTESEGTLANNLLSGLKDVAGGE